ncbi:MAG: DUF4190 domain-containing protein, partial [Candidatus Saccharimonadales bacterium]
RHMSTSRHHTDYHDAAIASLVLGILSLAGMGAVTGIPAIITGWIGLRNPVNKGMAIAGIVTGAISVFVTLMVILFVIFVILLGLFSFSAADDPGRFDNTPPRVSEPFFEQRKA